MQLSPAARLRLAIDQYRPALQKRLRFAAGIRETRRLQQLAEPDDAVTCADLVDPAMIGIGPLFATAS